jgi:succinoglycan biosynthesis protein ExoA
MNLLVSIIVPSLNEKEYIAKCIDSALSQSIGIENIEVLIVDGMSTDGTREIVLEYSAKFNNVRLLDNEKRITPVALNIGIMASKGEYIIIWGAHAEYSERFIEISLELMLSHPEVSCVGGPINSLGNTEFGKAAAIAMSSSIGVGNAKHRFPEYEGYAEMACFPVFRREVFGKYGMYDENLIKNQDDEFCFRLRLNEEKIFISPRVHSKYYTRNTPLSLYRQYFQYGFWRIAVLKKHKIPISFRQQVPAMFFSTVFLLIMISLLTNNILIGIIIPILYLIILVIFAFKNIMRSGIRTSAYIPLSVFILHSAYAFGFISGFRKFLIEPLFRRSRKHKKDLLKAGS